MADLSGPHERATRGAPRARDSEPAGHEDAAPASIGEPLAGCCPPDKLATCCEPSAKDACCAEPAPDVCACRP